MMQYMQDMVIEITNKWKKVNKMENKKEEQLQPDLTFNSKITIQNRISKDNNIYQVMLIGIENKKTGEIINIHEVYIKENLRQIIKFIIDQNIQDN